MESSMLLSCPQCGYTRAITGDVPCGEHYAVCPVCKKKFPFYKSEKTVALLIEEEGESTQYKVTDTAQQITADKDTFLPEPEKRESGSLACDFSEEAFIAASSKEDAGAAVIWPHVAEKNFWQSAGALGQKVWAVALKAVCSLYLWLRKLTRYTFSVLWKILKNRYVFFLLMSFIFIAPLYLLFFTVTTDATIEGPFIKRLYMPAVYVGLFCAVTFFLPFGWSFWRLFPKKIPKTVRAVFIAFFILPLSLAYGFVSMPYICKYFADNPAGPGQYETVITGYQKTASFGRPPFIYLRDLQNNSQRYVLKFYNDFQEIEQGAFLTFSARKGLYNLMYDIHIMEIEPRKE